MLMPRDASTLECVRNDVVCTSKHTTLYDSDESATAGCDENANTDDRSLKTPIAVLFANQRKPHRQRVETKLFLALAYDLG
jgi:hypothetical protein